VGRVHHHTAARIAVTFAGLQRLHPDSRKVSAGWRLRPDPSYNRAMKAPRLGHWPIALALLFLWAAVAVVGRLSMERCDHRLVYPLDDTYITMAMGKNLAEHGVWGVTRFEFASSSSSILWPIVMAATYRIAGTNEAAPLLWNLVFATAV